MKRVNEKVKPTFITSLVNSIELSLGQIMTILAQEHNEQVAIDLTKKICLESDSKEIQRKGLEFLYINGFYEELEILIIKNLASEDIQNRQWAHVYQLTINRRKKKQSPIKMIEQLNAIKTNDPELVCIIELTKVALYHDMKQFGKIGNFLDMQHGLFERIKDTFFLNCINLRLYQYLFVYYWVRNELIMARKYAFRAINQTKNEDTIANLHLSLGLTYTFDTYHQGMYHLNEALKLSKRTNNKKLQHRIIQRNIPFISAQFKRVEGVTTEDKSEQAHIEIAKGNYNQAIAILEKLPIKSPFQMYYLGVAKQDKNILLQSYDFFIVKRSDYFFSRLPLNALKRIND
ncbi:MULTISPECIES: AimR family lysis-lysogeny pheromone receptor [unclassified Virgibacillus]|uniref:AimR family lysis-lysogeny pheromone receptor n=1 Tax=unclassified Virgibacillus TaxID=2620237 RepID=UPI0024DE2E0A|nr:AimR family lysis-lysogeny pheromone receptor [Virgibacillus sp. LDC-1]